MEVGERNFLLGLLTAGRGRGGMLPKQEAEPNLQPAAEQDPALQADKELKHKLGHTGTRRNSRKSKKIKGEISF